MKIIFPAMLRFAEVSMCDTTGLSAINIRVRGKPEPGLKCASRTSVCQLLNAGKEVLRRLPGTQTGRSNVQIAASSKQTQLTTGPSLTVGAPCFSRTVVPRSNCPVKRSGLEQCRGLRGGNQGLAIHSRGAMLRVITAIAATRIEGTIRHSRPLTRPWMLPVE